MTDRTHILVLNYNGRGAAGRVLALASWRPPARSPVPCRRDRRRQRLDRRLARRPGAATGRRSASVREPNRGLASFNRVLARLDEPVVLLLNNDVKLDPGRGRRRCSRPSTRHDDALFSAPSCWTFDGRHVRGDADAGPDPVRPGAGDVPGARASRTSLRVARPDRGGRAGPGGRSPQVPGARRLRPDLFPRPDRGPRPGLPGLDGGLAGLLRPRVGGLSPRVRLVRPGVRARRGATDLACRNTLIFAWKNLSGRRLLAHLAWLPVRLGPCACCAGGSASRRGCSRPCGRLGRVLGGPARAGRRAGRTGSHGRRRFSTVSLVSSDSTNPVGHRRSRR